MAAAATAYYGDRDLKTKAEETTIASDSESNDILTKRRKDAMVDLAGGSSASNNPTAEAHGTKRKEASPSEDDDAAAIKKKKKKKKKKEEESDSLFKEGEMLKLRAERLWSQKLVPGALDRWLETKKQSTQVPAVVVAGKKRRVVRVILPDDYIDHINENPGMMRELSDEEMAKCPERFRQTYAITKVINAKNRVYQQALIDQHRAFGFAYDEKEVTDDDVEKEVAVVKD